MEFSSSAKLLITRRLAKLTKVEGSITYHYDLISLLIIDANQNNSLPVYDPYLDVRATCISIDSAPDG